MTGGGFEHATLFALLGSDDDDSTSPRDGDAAVASPRQPARASAAAAPKRGAQNAKPQQRGAQPRQAQQQPQQQPEAPVEDFYRAFEHAYYDPVSRETVLRFHKTLVVRIRPDGDVMLSSGGWYTASTVSALNDALYALDMALTFEPPVSAGRWIVTDDDGNRWQFKDRMVLKASRPEHRSRGQHLLAAYNGGANVPRYTSKHTAAAPAAAPRPPQQQHQQQPHQHQQPRAVNYAAASAASAGPRPAGAEQVKAQLEAQMAKLGMTEDEMVGDDHLCVVCLENIRNEVLVPCGHLVLCHVCCESIRETSNECPMCRETIEDHCVVDPSW